MSNIYAIVTQRIGSTNDPEIIGVCLNGLIRWLCEHHATDGLLKIAMLLQNDEVWPATPELLIVRCGENLLPLVLKCCGKIATKTDELNLNCGITEAQAYRLQKCQELEIPDDIQGMWDMFRRIQARDGQRSVMDLWYEAGEHPKKRVRKKS